MDQTGRRIFYGWRVVAGTSVVQALNAGLVFYNLPVLLAALVSQRPFSLSETSGATSVFFLFSGLGGLAVGQLVDRFDIRKVIVVGATLGALSFGCLRFVVAAQDLYLFFAALGIGYACCGLVPATTIVTQWFEARRSLALSIASTGLSLGGIMVTPIAASLLASQGLSVSGILFGLALFIGVVPVTLLILRRPTEHEIEQERIGRPYENTLSRGKGDQWRIAVRSRFFVWVTIAYVCALGAQVGTITHIVLLVVERGNAQIAPAVVAAVATASVLGRLGGGWLLLSLSSYTFAVGMFILQIAGIIAIATAHSAPAILLGACLFGSTVGNVLILQSLLLADAFGSMNYGRIYSLSLFIGIAGVASAPALVGFLFDRFHDYQSAYLAIAAAAALGLLALLCAGRREAGSAGASSKDRRRSLS